MVSRRARARLYTEIERKLAHTLALHDSRVSRVSKTGRRNYLSRSRVRLLLVPESAVCNQLFPDILLFDVHPGFPCGKLPVRPA